MRGFIVAAAVVALSGCGQTPPEETFEKVTPEELVTPKTAEAPAVKLEDRDLIRVCKAGSAFRVGRSVEGIDAKVTEEQQVRIAYTRDADGKFFEYDCRVEGNVLRFRMIDERGPGTGPGTWSGRGSTTTYKLKPGSVELNDDFFDGSSDSDEIEI